jgi:xylulose-5-phosphate/fructose-6-phosphate phosphoketolase
MSSRKATDALKHMPRLRSQASDVIDVFNRKLYEQHTYTRQHFQDMPEIRNWSWTKDFSGTTAPAPPPRDSPAHSYSQTLDQAVRLISVI